MKIILVDDEGDLLQQAKIFLERLDDELQVDTFTSPEMALNKIEEEDYDAVVSDYQMPDIDGLELLKNVREEREMDIPFIMFTDKGREEVAMEALNLGANRYLQKGGDPKAQYRVLNEAIRNEISHHRANKRIIELNSLLNSIRSVNRLITQEDDIETLLKKSADLLVQTRGYKNTSISLTDENGKLKSVARSGDHRERRWEIDLEGDESTPKCLEKMIESNSIVHLKNRQDHCSDFTHFEKDPHHETILIPLRYENELLGILDICHKPEHTINKEEKDLLIEVADDLSLAIDKLKTKKMLKESEERFRSLAKSIPAVIYLCRNDKRYTMLFICDYIEDITGYPKEYFLQDEMSIVDVFHPDDVDEIYKKVDKAVENKSTFHLEYRIKDADGDTRWLEESGKAIYEGGDAKYLVGSIQDVTEEKRVEKESKESKQRLELALKGAELGLWDWNIKKGEVKYNERSAEMLGSSVDELNGPLDSWEKRVHPEDLPRVKREVDRHLKGETDIYKTEHRLKTKSGEWIWVKNVGRVFERDENGEPVRAIGIQEDITERKKWEEHLDESKRKIEKLQKVSTELQTYDTEEDVYTFAVKTAEEVLDFHVCEINVPSDDEMKSVARSTDFQEEIVSKMKPFFIDSSIAGKTYLENKSFLIEDIKNVDYANPRLEDYRSAISVPMGEHGVFQALSREVDFFDEEDLKMAQLLISHVSEALHRIQMNKREDFLHSLLRHDIGNKNQIIKGYLEILKDYEISDEAKEFLRKAEHAAKDSIEMIEKIRKLRRIEKEEEVYEIPLNTVFDKLISENQAKLQKKDIEIDISECGFDVKSGYLLEEMFSNLITNSIQHSNCSKIRISSRTEEDECIVSIEDDGIGIPDDTKDKVFERGFKRGRRAGTGLGLYMVKEIAESYGGSVEVMDSELGGARFDVYLKRA